MWPADERDPRAAGEKSEARAAAKAKRVRAANVERALQRGAGRAEQAERLREAGRSGCSAERAMRSRLEGGKGRDSWAKRLARLSVGGEEGKGPANSWAGLKRKE